MGDGFGKVLRVEGHPSTLTGPPRKVLASARATFRSPMDLEKRDQFSGRLLREVNASMSVLTLYLGDRLGLFKAIHEMGSVTPQTLAERVKGSERYLREWLECMAVNDYLEHDPSTGTFHLTDEQASVLLDSDARGYAIPHVLLIPSFSSVLPDLIQGFRDGRGVPFERYGPDLAEAIAAGNRASLVNDLVSKWIPAMPDIESRLRVGGQVADVGCGKGWLSILLAQAFPRTTVEAIDLDPLSLKEASRNVERAGLGHRVVFHRGSLEEAKVSGPFDLITAVESVHDMARPVVVLRRMRELLGAEGAVLVVEEAVGENVEENRNFRGRLEYNFSVLHCLPQAMTEPGSAATGSVMSVSTFRSYAMAAGFQRVEVLPISHPTWRFYRLGN